MEPRIERTTKVARKVDSGTTQLQQMEALLYTLLRLEAIRANAYDRWQPFFNQGTDFLGLVAYLNVFHNDQTIIQKLERYFRSRQKVLSELKKDRSNPKLVGKLQQYKSAGLELMENLKEKIYSLQLTAEEFHTVTVN